MTLEERLEKYLGKTPQVDPTAYVSKHAVLVGDVKIAAEASVWPGCVNWERSISRKDMISIPIW